MKINSKERKVWFTSDSHFGHQNICKGTSNWSGTQRCRDFATVEEMNQAIVEGINSVVGEDDILFHLGDWSFGGIQNIWNFRKQLKVKEIHLVLGNHDHHIEHNKVLPNYGIPVELRAKELFSSVSHYKVIYVDKQMIILSHFAFRVWDQSHKSSIHLYGHSHSTLEEIPYGKSMDVGIDNAYRIFGEYRPFSYGEILGIMNKRDVNIVDHHDSFTS